VANGKKSRKKLWIGIILVLVVLLVAGGLYAMKSGGTKIDASKLGKVEQGDLAKSVVATGKIEPITKVEIKSKASGIVKKLYVDAGEFVKSGTLLAELDKDEIMASVNQARAGFEAAQGNLAAAEADIERARFDAEGVDVPTLKRAFERAQQMSRDGVISASALDDAERSYKLAVNKQQSAQAQLIVGKSRVKQAASQVAQSKATLDQLEQQLHYTTIVAPMDGIILSRDVEVGAAVSSILVNGSSATLIMTMGDTHEVYVKGKVDESDIAKVYLGQPARIKVESFKDKSFDGKVTKISPLGVEKDNVTTFEVRVSINNDKGELKAEMTANAEIILEEHKNVLYIPEGSLIYDKDKKASVEIPDAKAPDGKKKLAVSVGISNGSKTELLPGSQLKKDDQVVLQ
jgi:HlyD family secretion protein